MNSKFALATAICLSICVMPIASAADDPIFEIRPGALRAHIRFLADDLLEGRGTGTRGFDIAAKYVAAQLRRLASNRAIRDHFFSHSS